jgi:type I restriction enzyme M protein
VQKDKKGNIIYDKETKDTEIVKWAEDIDTYMQREVLPHIPDAKAFWEEDLNAKKPIIKTGAEIPFTRYFYKYETMSPAEEYLKKFMTLQTQIENGIKELDK